MTAGDDTTTPAARLRLLQAEFLQPGPGERAERVTTSTTPAAPIRLSVYEHIRASVEEAAEHTRAAAPDAAPRPRGLDELYGWMVAETAHLDAERQQARDALIYRQGLEHAILMGEESVIRRHACPGCATWSLFWRPERRAAVCVNRYCADDDGVSTYWTLAQIAKEYIARQAVSARRAT
ncbi:hypothetical protein XF35_39120 [Streptomyces platensis subsp. clarensis]|uniref:Uncharacterized protein n=1 Tax=Streptomyces showdoensis TaxID=68268 RepID=A0A2P2GKP6_STREW|nr:hypothetical protein [Streptomyces showdoensis]KKZ72093.1 hypothetical protein VO63_20155 [Streptomyces showdoensis]MCW7991070.1 hypothetical protein [Streptomyces platensis subsp. clarensis]